MAFVCLTGDDGLHKRTIKQGDVGRQTPRPGQRVTVRYVGTLAANGAVFDSSEKQGGPFAFVLGRGDVIRGWDVAVASMVVGEVAELRLRHDYAYGEAGLPGRIPPHAELHFRVTLLSAEDVVVHASEAAAGSVRLALPDMPSHASTSAGSSAGGAPRVPINGAAVPLDDVMGPLVINSDGTTSRITNWNEMTAGEKQRTMRVITKRNRKRLAKLKRDGDREEAESGHKDVADADDGRRRGGGEGV